MKNFTSINKEKNKEISKMGIYIHIPFCVKKCDYCDFLSAPAGEETRKRYVEALIKEIRLSQKKMQDYIVDTVFVGGGTPSILEGEDIARVLGELKDSCRFDDNCEITIECNPGTLTKEKLESYKKAGINRLSIGLQTADDNELKSIGRIHTWKEFQDNYLLAREVGFSNINVDLMSSLPGQTSKSYENTIRKVLNLKPEHISAYSLIVEDDTPLKVRVDRAEEIGKSILPDEDEERRMYYLTEEILKSEGYTRYEISNYSKKGYACRHNCGYWTRKEYLGFGIGAASLYKEERYNNTSNINLYIEEMENAANHKTLNYIEENREALSANEQMEEFMFLGLRMMEGISLRVFEEKFGNTYKEVYGEVTDRLINKGLLERKNECIRLTTRGIDISNYVMSEFLF